MKTKALVLAVFSLGVLALAAAGKTPRAKLVAPVITITGSGNQVVILGGRLATSKAAATMASGTMLVSAKSALASGQVVFLGPTSSTAADTVVVSPRAKGALPPLSASIDRQVFAGDLVHGTPGPGGLTLGSTTETTGGFVFGENGFPVSVTAAPNGAATLEIGPNGFPTLGSSTPTIDTNGFPTLGSPAATPTIVTNGFPAGTGTVFGTSLTTAGSATTIVVPARARTTAGATPRASGSGASAMAASPR